MGRLSMLFCLLMACVVSIADAGELRTWTSKNGKYTLEAELTAVSEDGQEVTLKDAKGKSKDVKLSVLCPDDGMYANEWKERKKNELSEESAPFQESDESESKDSIVPAPTTERKNDVHEKNDGRLFGVSLGDTVEQVRQNCEVIDETYDEKSNWRIIKVKAGEGGAECLNAYFMNTDTVGQFELIFKNPSKENARKIANALKRVAKFPAEYEEWSDNGCDHGWIYFLRDKNSKPYVYFRFSGEEKGKKAEMFFRCVDITKEVYAPDKLREEAYPIAKKMILGRLKAPSTAIFEPLEDINENACFFWSSYKGERWFQHENLHLSMSVEAKNPYNVLIRSNYFVELKYEDGKLSETNGDISVLEGD